MPNPPQQGRLIWVTGLAGAGKTTFSLKLKDLFSERDIPCCLLDGDEVREAFGNDLSFSSEDRKKAAMRVSRLGKLLADQGLHVICSTISMFEDVRDWNRANNSQYTEIYLKVSPAVLQQRDKKGLYSTKDEVVCLEKYEEPRNPHFEFRDIALSEVPTYGQKVVESVLGY